MIQPFRFIIYSNFWVSFCFACLTSTSFLNKNSFDWFYILFCFFGTLGVYNLQRWIKLDHNENNTDREKWYLSRKIELFVFGAIALLIGGVCYSLSNHDEWWVMLLCLFTTFFYLPPKQVRILHFRSIGVLKLLSISLVWALLSIPEFCDDSYALIVFRMLWIIGITIPFDIRDIYKDEVDQIKSLPQSIGETKSRWLALMCFVVGIIGELTVLEGANSKLLGYIPIVIIGSGLVFFSRKTSSDWYIAGIVESIPALFLLNVFLLQYLN